ncbi:hypothetical protein [Bythopirellula polymerisocia]|uniref:Uncharacterized protein n=1 Tax=Bythopirellula polymerisocia TaxID=2528003 RepID=A0A5C6CVH1_9BACT|nr:hypothetical protein [Bythopirellula polymerisocia]TWU27507.1 hypothetical protein Pla144_22810 [Bythopirellula polymerisocia]
MHAFYTSTIQLLDARENLEVDLATPDHKCIYRKVFDEISAKCGVRVKTLSFRSPKLNAYAEHFY